MLLVAPLASAGEPSAQGQSISQNWLAGVPEDGQLSYEIVRKEKRLGFQTLNFSKNDDGDLVVDVYIRIDFKFGFIPLFRYLHENREIWRDGQLMALVSKTDNNGDDEFASLRRTANGLVGSGTKVAGAITHAALSTSYFNPNFIRQEALISSQDGRVLEVDIEEVGIDTMPTPDGPVEAVHYRLSGDLRLDIWYSRAGRWVGSAFKIGDETIRIRPVKAQDLPDRKTWRRP